LPDHNWCGSLKFTFKNQIVMMHDIYFIKACKEWFSDESSFIRQQLYIRLSSIILLYKTLGLYFIEIGNHRFQIEVNDFEVISRVLNEPKNSSL